MKNILLLLIYVCSIKLSFGQHPNPIVLGKARFTIIDDGLIRMEYATDAKFTDEATMFATNRNALSRSFEFDKDGNKYTITTSKMKVKYILDNLPFSEKNIKITVFNSPKNYEWGIRSEDDKNLGGTLSTLDNIWGRLRLNQVYCREMVGT